MGFLQQIKTNTLETSNSETLLLFSCISAYQIAKAAFLNFFFKKKKKNFELSWNNSYNAAQKRNKIL